MAKIYEFEKEPEIEEIQMSYKVMMELLDTLKEKPCYKLQFENIKIKYNTTIEDTANGKREFFVIERKIW